MIWNLLLPDLNALMTGDILMISGRVPSTMAVLIILDQDLDRINKLSSLLGISHLLHRKIDGLSGGEQQRVALGRALSFYPRVICLDEPLSALDEKTREEMYRLLLKLKEELNVTALHISHSRSEAVKLASKLLVIKDGVLVQKQLN